MSTQTPTRRSFLKGGALLAVPALAATAAATAATGQEGEAAIRDLHQAWLRRIDAGDREPLLDLAVRRITPDLSGAVDRIELAADGRSATGQYDCRVEWQTPLPLDSTLAQMAHAQGHGSVQHSQRRTLRVEYVQAAAGWRIDRLHWVS